MMMTMMMPLSSFSPSGSSLPSFHLTSSSQRRAGGTSVLFDCLLATSPPPVLHPLNSHATHLTPPVHENWPFEILDLDSFRDLSVKRISVDSSDSHAVWDPLPVLVVMYTVEPKHRFLLIAGCQAVKVLLTSTKCIPASLTLVSSDLLSAFITPKVICNGLEPTIAPLLSSTWKTFWPPTLLTSPWI